MIELRRWEVWCDWARPTINPYIHESDAGILLERHWTRRAAERGKRWHDANASGSVFGGAYITVRRRRRGR